METICVPATAATAKLHLGNLYNWILIDVYRRAGSLRGSNVSAPETWNCYSQRLEESVTAEMPEGTKEEIRAECTNRVEAAIVAAKGIFDKYFIKFEGPPIRDDSPEYTQFVYEWLKRREEEGILREYALEQPPIEQIASNAQQIQWLGRNDSWKGFFGLRNPIEKIRVFREGYYGIPLGQDKVVGQRVVQFLLPDFHAATRGTAEIGIFGKDILTKLIYFIIANSEWPIPLRKIGLSGIVLGTDHKKMSKYDGAFNHIDEIDSHPDNVRLSLVKRPFGRDFVQPNFEEEEKLRRKAYNAFIFLIEHTVINKKSTQYPTRGLEDTKEKIARAIQSLDYSSAYQHFRGYIFDELSGRIISNIRSEGVQREELERYRSSLENVLRVFIPKTCEDLNGP